MAYLYTTMDSPVGRLMLVARGAKLAAVLWPDDRPGRVRLGPLQPSDNAPILLAARCQLDEYFTGARRRFDLDLEFTGTEFQQRVWRALLTIPYGETRSYRDIAVQIGNPTAVRAVGAANGKNPLSIIAPCHRVIGSSGQLTGFAGGLEAKRILLRQESPSLFERLL